MNKEFNKIFTELRKSCNLTQADCSKIFNVTKSTISGWETGRNEPNITTLINIADYFNVSIDYLAGREQFDGTKIIKENKSDTLLLELRNIAIIHDNNGSVYRFNLNKEQINAVITILKSSKGANNYY